MKLGYSVTSSFPATTEPTEKAAGLLSKVETAREHGFEYVQMGDHHVMADADNRPDQYLQNVPLAARLSETFDHVAPLFLLPLYNPILVAEQVGTVAAFAEHVDVWCVLGWRESEYEAFDVPFSDRGDRLEENISAIDRLWTTDDVTFDGQFHSFSNVSVNPKPDSARFCLGGSAKPAIQRAARLGDAWVAPPSMRLGALEPRIDDFRSEGGGDVVVRRDALVLSDHDRATSLAEDLLIEGYRGWAVDADWPLVGDADHVADQLGALADLGVDEVVVRPMSDRHAAETLEGVARARSLL